MSQPRYFLTKVLDIFSETRFYGATKLRALTK